MAKWYRGPSKVGGTIKHRDVVFTCIEVGEREYAPGKKCREETFESECPSCRKVWRQVRSMNENLTKSCSAGCRGEVRKDNTAKWLEACRAGKAKARAEALARGEDPDAAWKAAMKAGRAKWAAENPEKAAAATAKWVEAMKAGRERKKLEDPDWEKRVAEKTSARLKAKFAKNRAEKVYLNARVVWDGRDMFLGDTLETEAGTKLTFTHMGEPQVSCAGNSYVLHMFQTNCWRCGAKFEVGAVLKPDGSPQNVRIVCYDCEPKRENKAKAQIPVTVQKRAEIINAVIEQPRRDSAVPAEHQMAPKTEVTRLQHERRVAANWNLLNSAYTRAGMSPLGAQPCKTKWAETINHLSELMARSPRSLTGQLRITRDTIAAAVEAGVDKPEGV